MKKIIFSVDNVLPQMQLLSKVITGKSSILILDDLRVIYKQDKLSLMAADGETWLSVYVDGKEETNQDVDICVDIRKFIQSLQGLSNKVVTLAIDEEKHSLRGKYDNGYFMLPFKDTNEYPMPPSDETPRKIEINAKNLLRGINMAEYAVANDELRPIMNGIRFDFLCDKLVCVASDGHRLVKYTDYAIKSGDEPFAFSLAKKPSSLLTSLLQKSDEDVTLMFNDANISISASWFQMKSRLIVGRYPNYDMVIPQNNAKRVEFDKNAVLDALRRIMPFGSNSTELTVFHFMGNNMELSTEDIDFSTNAQENVPCVSNTMEDMKIGLKGSFISQTIQNVPSDEVVLEYDSPNRAIIVKPKSTTQEFDYISIQMPMVLNG